MDFYKLVSRFPLYKAGHNSANYMDLESLESVSYEAMRISSGYFISTPMSSLQVITEQPPFQIRRDII